MTTNKPKVRRYDCTSGGFQYCYGCYTMKEDEMGDYVEWGAYEALQAENERLLEALEDIGASWDGEGYMRNVARRALAAYHKGSES